MCAKENLVLDSLIYLKPEESFKNRSNVVKFMSFGDSTSCRVEDKLKTIGLCGMQIEYIEESYNSEF